MNIGMPMPPSLWIIICMSAYICVRLAASVSPRAATSSWSNFSFFQPASFQGASDLKNSVSSQVGAGARVDVAEAHRVLHPVRATSSRRPACA